MNDHNLHPQIDYSNSTVLRVFVLEKNSQEPDPIRCGVNMPVNSKVVQILNLPGGRIGLATMCDVNAVRVWHPITVAIMDQAVTKPLGKTYGDPLGIVPMKGEPAALLPELPWPTSALEAQKAAGEA